MNAMKDYSSLDDLQIDVEKETARDESMLFSRQTSDRECLHEFAVQMDEGSARSET
jgi:hypothetical protein